MFDTTAGLSTATTARLTKGTKARRQKGMKAERHEGRRAVTPCLHAFMPQCLLPCAAAPRLGAWLCGLLLAAVASQGASGGAADLHVPGDFTTIQQAIDAAQHGDTVIVAPGTYNEAINFLGKEITVRGAAPGSAADTVIDATGLNASVVLFEDGETPQTVLKGFTLTGGTGTLAPFGGTLQGGGIFCNNKSNPTIINCIVRGNTAQIGGGLSVFDFSSPVILNTVFAENVGEFQGGATGHFVDSNPIYINCTFVNNVAPFGGAIDIATFCHPILVNCIVWGNDTTGAGQFSGFPEVRDSIVEGGYEDGENIIEDDPLFIDAANGDYRLAPGSPAIDAGDNQAIDDEAAGTPAAKIDFDLAGNPRFVDGTGDGQVVIDLGALEFQPDDPKPTPCPGDLTGNGSVGVADLLQLLSCWGDTSGGGGGGGSDKCEAGDLTGNGSVGVADLLDLLSQWGDCPR